MMFMRRRKVEPIPVEGTPSIRIIRSEEELHAALVRAARFERQAAEAHRARVAHYEAMLSERMVTTRRQDGAL
jgi:hypothetical protein